MIRKLSKLALYPARSVESRLLRIRLSGICRSVAAGERVGRGRNALAPKPPHFKPRAKRVIFLFMQGAPSHVDTFDYKPRLQADDGKTVDGKGGTQADEVAVQVQPSMARAGCGCRISFRTWPSMPTICACSIACTPTSACIRRP